MSYKDKKKSNVFKSKEGYNLYAPFYDQRLAYLNSFEKDVLWKFLGEVRGKKVLDIGCGSGRIIRELLNRGAKLAAGDISEEMLKIVKNKFSNVETVLADIEKMPFADCSFDLIIAAFVIVHLKELEMAFEEVSRVLKEGGVFIVTNINQRKAPKLKLDKRREIVIKSYYHRPSDVTAALEKNFFKIEKEEFVYEKGVWINQIVKAVK